MAQVLVVADDLTGANATGARFARSGMRVATVTPEHVAAVAEEYDVVVANLDTRHASAEQAADLVTDVVEALWPVGLVVKRTDSTLRGNVGAELEAAWHAVRERVPAQVPVRALLVPAFPASGRTTVEGVQLLDGRPLEATELARDPFWPMDTGDVAAILARQTDLAVRRVPDRQVTQDMLAADLRAGDEPVLLCDAADERRIEDLAGAAAEVHRTDGTVWVAADPGPGGALLAYALRLRGQARAPGPLLAVAGSTTDLTREQFAALARTGPARFVDVDPERLGGAGDHADEVCRRLADQLTSAVFPEVVVLRALAPAGDSPVAARALPGRLADLVAEVVAAVGDEAGSHALPSGVYLTGGDVAASVLEALDVHAFEVAGEVLPLAVHGALSGGPLDGVPAVVKGGLVGDSAAAVECLARLRRAARARLQQVHSEVSEHVLPPAHRAPQGAAWGGARPA
ncbi:four-carbon acid sugar kinase family protein [Streptomonospora sp. S1-112]|uniref:Four-carbon acid sugar kinase family protein n=1 Tax=Streptomonospora mangrovi TaxID=2883123 RepID=A0A9X3SFC9_9ACTN|nr:four-carbon acid sugar kinase family protein [Streptomonospora mangrovi]MDA0562844.1 four-carbon acid sugar kinase family protein [Streptomonospora mangrovi]